MWIFAVLFSVEQKHFFVLIQSDPKNVSALNVAIYCKLSAL